MHWYGNPMWFAVPLDVNLWEVFGKGCFVMEQKTHRIVPIDGSGFAAAPLEAGGVYSLFGKNGSKLIKECHHLRSQLGLVRGELQRVQQRSQRFETVTQEQLRAATTLLQKAVDIGRDGRGADLELIEGAIGALQVAQRRIDAVQQALPPAEPPVERAVSASADGAGGQGGASAEEVAEEGAREEQPRAQAASGEESSAERAQSGAEVSASSAPLPQHASAPAPPDGVLTVAVTQRGGCARGKPDYPHQWARQSKLRTLGKGELMTYVPVGYIRSCFAEKNGTPRQGSVCPASRASLELKLPNNLNARHSLDGLETFSHVWLLWHFHQNGPASIRSKVAPPRLDGERVGLFATRSPHRPNAVGLSAVRLDRIEGSTLHLSGVDLIDGTPVLDVKPYVPLADSLPPAEVRVPWWLRPETAPVHDLEVVMEPGAREQLRALQAALNFFASADDAEEAIRQVLRADPRSVYWRHAHSDEQYGFSIDQLNVVCRFDDGGRAVVTSVQHLALSDRAHLQPGDNRTT